MVIASAPGKAFLLGEYAVLSGAPALLAALDRRCRVQIADAPGWSVTARFGGNEHVAGFAVAAGGQLIWQRGVADRRRGDLALIEAVFAGLAATLPDKTLTMRPGHVSVDTRDFYRGDTKMGLGSSAAATVALAGAISAWAGAGTPSLAALVATHRRFQHGRGSGADIAASLRGGVVRVQPGPPGSGPSSATPVPLPSGLCIGWFWTGVAANTRNYLDTLKDWRQREPDRAAELIGRLCNIARRDWTDAADFVELVGDYANALGHLDLASGLGVYAGAHVTLRDLAGKCRLVYKPCGAGGGDLGLAVATRDGTLNAFTDRARSAGIQTLPVQIDPVGLSVQTIDEHTAG